MLGTVQTLAPSSDYKQAAGPHGATSDSRLYALQSSPNVPNNHDIDNVRGGSGIGYGEENSKVLDVDPENAKDFHRAYRKVSD